MDFKEFMELCEHIKIFPRLMSKAKLAKHFEAANSFVELRDDVRICVSDGLVFTLLEDRHEFSFDEYKYVMIQIATELGVKIIVNTSRATHRNKLISEQVNGRDLTAKLFIADITDKT
eukprot:764091-Hanusia_phi.AAC.27